MHGVFVMPQVIRPLAATNVFNYDRQWECLDISDAASFLPALRPASPRCLKVGGLVERPKRFARAGFRRAPRSPGTIASKGGAVSGNGKASPWQPF